MPARIHRLARPLAAIGATVCLFACVSVSAKVVHVNANAAGATHDGIAWSTAFLAVQEALDAAQRGDEVWVASSAPAGAAYAENITLPTDVALYGGFAGTEAVRGRRDWKTNATILDGSKRITASVVTSSVKGALVDGFTVRGGGAGIGLNAGTATVTNCTISGNSNFGIRVYNGTATIANCTISRNNHGIYVDDAATVTNCTITGNTYSGIDVYSRGTATVANCIISGNSYGAYVNGTATITNCTVTGNSAGIGVDSYVYSSGTAIVKNCDISGNGNGIYAYGGTATLTNSTISGNTCSGVEVFSMGTATITNCTIGGNDAGIYADFDGIDAYSGKTSITNCVVAFNSVGISGISTSATVTSSHNDVYGGAYAGFTDPAGTHGNISQDPLFVNRSGGDYRLSAGSPCIDAGDDSVVIPGETDKDAKSRKQGAHVDMGAYEFAPIPTAVARKTAGPEAKPWRKETRMAKLGNWEIGRLGNGFRPIPCVGFSRRSGRQPPNSFGRADISSKQRNRWLISSNFE